MEERVCRETHHQKTPLHTTTTAAQAALSRLHWFYWDAPAEGSSTRWAVTGRTIIRLSKVPQAEVAAMLRQRLRGHTSRVSVLVNVSLQRSDRPVWVRTRVKQSRKWERTHCTLTGILTKDHSGGSERGRGL